MNILVSPEHVPIEERHERAERRARQQRIGILARLVEEETIERQGYRAESRGQAVDAVNQIDGVDHVYHEQDRQQPAYYRRNLVYAGETVKIVYPGARHKEECPDDDLKHKFGPVAHAYQVVGDADKIHQHQSAKQEEHRNKRTRQSRVHARDLKPDVAPHDDTEREYERRQKRYPAKTRHDPAVDLAVVDFIKEFAAERDGHNVGDDESRQHDRHDET